MIGFPIEITSSTIGFQIFAITAGIKKYKSIIKKKTKKHIIHEQFVLTNNVLKEYDKMKEEIKDLKI